MGSIGSEKLMLWASHLGASMLSVTRSGLPPMKGKPAIRTSERIALSVQFDHLLAVVSSAALDGRAVREMRRRDLFDLEFR